MLLKILCQVCSQSAAEGFGVRRFVTFSRDYSRHSTGRISVKSLNRGKQKSENEGLVAFLSTGVHGSGQYSLVSGVLVSFGESFLFRVVKLRGDILNAPYAERRELTSGVPVASIASTLVVSENSFSEWKRLQRVLVALISCPS